MTSVEIDFDNKIQFFPGETVTGKIEINLKKNIKVKKLILAIRGRAKVQWRDHKLQITGSKETTYIGNDIFFNSIVPLIPNKMVLPAGNHSYEFEFVLPQNLPSSDKEMVLSDGYEIKYEAVVYFVRPWNTDLKFGKELKVLYGFDLNLSPTLIVPISLEDEESLTTIARMGYVAGEEIPVNVQIKNPNNSQITRIVCSLKKIVSHTFISTSSKLCSTTSDHKLSEKIEEFSPDQTEYKFWLDIPGEKSPPSTVDPNMRLINIQYKLIVKLQQTRMRLMVEDVSVLEFPIVIGAIPLQQTNMS